MFRAGIDLRHPTTKANKQSPGSGYQGNKHIDFFSFNDFFWQVKKPFFSPLKSTDFSKIRSTASLFCSI